MDRMGFRRKLWAVPLFCVLAAPAGAQTNAFPASGLEGSVADGAAGQTDTTTSIASSCRMTMTEREAKHCLAGSAPVTPLPKLDPKHVYSLPELIDIAESANPDGRIAWEEAKRSLERVGAKPKRCPPSRDTQAQKRPAQTFRKMWAWCSPPSAVLTERRRVR